jgi:transcription termination factor Rho
VNDSSKPKSWEEIPFGALEVPPDVEPPKPAAPTEFQPTVHLNRPVTPLPPREPAPARRAPGDDRGGRGEPRPGRGEDRQGRRRRDEGAGGAAEAERRASGSEPERRDAPEGEPSSEGDWDGPEGEGGESAGGGSDRGEWGDGQRRRRRRGRRGRGGRGFEGGPRPEGAARPASDGAPAAAETDLEPREGPAEARAPHGHGQRPHHERAPAQVLTGMLVMEKSGHGVLRRIEAQYLPSKEDIWVPQHLVQRLKLREGSLITGPCGRGHQQKYALLSVDQVDGKDPRQMLDVPQFKKLTSIDPDFHYAVGDVQGDVSMRVLDVVCPVGRGSRGLIVAPPRSGKTILMRKFANAITEGYPDVNLIVLLVDERPEEATEWQRSTKGQVFVSTNDEDTKNHVEIAEVVFKRCQRLVELGQDVVLLLDSITRLARAYNNHAGTSGKTMSGGLDSRAMERPRAFFGMARNTETAGSLTILGTTLVDTGSRLDQMVFEEFKGTGNMEIVLSRKLADRRIFPAIDVERSGTRKEEKLHSSTRLRRVQVLRRVLLKMNFAEAMELLVHKLENVDKLDDFLKRFDVDPDA